MSTSLSNKVLIVDDERDMLALLTKVLSKKGGCAVSQASSAEEAMRLMQVEPPEVVLSDIKMPGMDGMQFLSRINEMQPAVTTVLMTGYGTIDMAVQALKEGAYDFIEKPFDNERILGTVKRALERTRLLRDNQRLHSELAYRSQPLGFIGRSKPLEETLALLRRVAHSKVTVLIRGASGTGKELAARALHALSDRALRPMITVNCPALPEQILESELFGYRRGAFTGADRDKSGLFVEAQGSTIFLDEIADIPVNVQTKLLRVLQEKEIQPLGQNQTFPVDVRIVASTNQDLETKIKRGEFREDLFYRLNVMTLHMPSLAQMKSDIPLLAQHFLEQYRREHGRSGLEFSDQAMQWLMRRAWPGNGRELQNAVNRAVLLAQGEVIELFDLCEGQELQPLDMLQEPFTFSSSMNYKAAKAQVLTRFNAAFLAAALSASSGNITAAAKACGMERQALQRLLRRYAIHSSEFHP